MAKLKFKLSKAQYDEAKKGASQTVVTPGVYIARVVELKDEQKPDSGAPPRLVVTWQIERGDFKGRRRSVYINYGESSEWKMHQFLVSVGAVKPGKESTLDTDKISGLPLAQIRVGAGKPYNDEPTWDVKAMLPYDPDEDEEDDTEPEEPEDADEEEVDEDEPTDEYDGMSLAALRKEAKARELDTKGLDKNGLVELLRENDGAEDADEDEEPEEDEDEDEDEDTEDEEEDDEEDEEDEEEEDDEPEDYDSWTITNLRKEFTDRKLKLPRGKKIREVTKAYLVKKLVASDEDPVGDE